MLKFLILVLLIFLLTQTPFYKHHVVPEYKKFEKTVTNLLTVKPPEDLKKKPIFN